MTWLVNMSDLPLLEFEAPWSDPSVLQRVVSLVIIMCLSLTGNIYMILLLTCSKLRRRNSHINIFLLNLAIGDLLVCVVTMTGELLFVVFGHWVLGAVVCKLVVYGQVVTLASTTFLLVAMSYDRYRSICASRGGHMSKCQAKRLVLTAWVVATIVAVPQLFIFVQVDEGVFPDGSVKHTCRSEAYTAPWQRKLYVAWMTTYILLVPSVLITFCYVRVALTIWRQDVQHPQDTSSGTSSRCSLSSGSAHTSHSPVRNWRSKVLVRRDAERGGKQVCRQKMLSKAKMKMLKMTLMIISTFVVCWSPYFITTLITVYSNKQVVIPEAISVLTETMALLNSALNPFIYGFFNVRLILLACERCCCSFKYLRHERQSSSLRRTGAFRHCQHSKAEETGTIDECNKKPVTCWPRGKHRNSQRSAALSVGNKTVNVHKNHRYCRPSLHTSLSGNV